MFGYDWETVYEEINEAVENKDSAALVEMASPKLKEYNPYLKEMLDKMFSEIEGDIVDVTASANVDLGEEHEISSVVKTESE